VRSFLPFYDPLDEVGFPRNTAWMLIVSILIVLLSYILLKWRGRAQRDSSLPLVGQGAAWLASIAVLGSVWGLANFNYIKHATSLTTVNRWPLQPTPIDAAGIAYLDGKVFVADYRGKLVWAFDPSQATFQPLNAITQTTQLVYSQPGDVEAGPDGMLYVLNNGPGSDSLYVMRSDGTVTRRIPLEGKTEIAMDLTLGPDGALYIADMFGGRVAKYPAGGGAPLGHWGGVTNGFNNPAGIAVAPDGTMYVAELGNSRVQQLAPNGDYVRSYDLRCEPWHFAASGDWLDFTCNRGIRSINIKTGDLQLARLKEGAPPLAGPRGIAYAPDGTLYVLDGSVLIQFRVQH
jgi:DNA-binding beta-propeller fold protein YncE